MHCKSANAIKWLLLKLGSLSSRFETAERLSVVHLISCALACTCFWSYISRMCIRVNYIYKAVKCPTNESALN